jgi:hypothetical protein
VLAYGPGVAEGGLPGVFVLSNHEQVGLELAAAVSVRNGSKFSQSNVVLGSFPWGRGSECQKLDSGWCFIFA